jgi:hypothetical protein
VTPEFKARYFKDPVFKKTADTMAQDLGYKTAVSVPEEDWPTFLAVMREEERRRLLWPRGHSW